MINFFRKYHKWVGIILTLFIVMFALSGIILNHRKLFSSIDVNRNILPKEYRYNNWNNGAVKGVENLNKDSILIYGNIGVWLTDSLYQRFADFNNGFPKGTDNHKISKVFRNSEGELFAGTLFGLYKFNFNDKCWNPVALPGGHEQRVVDIIGKEDSLLILTRSHVLFTRNYKDFSVKELPAPIGYDNKTGLFKTLWVIHSGEIYGLVGKLLVDSVGVIFIFLSITGLIFFINRFRIRSFKKKNKATERIKKSSKWNLKWHNKIGWITIMLLVITTITGMFLRPPLLIAIARAKVSKIPYTLLDSQNPWFDKLRAVRYQNNTKSYIFSTSDGLYSANEALNRPLVLYKNVPPVSVMGINVFEKNSPNTYIVGSFSGIFEWNPESGVVINSISGNPYMLRGRPGPPVGDEAISGYLDNYKGMNVYFDYGKGALMSNKNENFVKMPDRLANTPMSLWNLALEVHTARIYKFMFGNFYILVVPLSGLFILFILISGFVVWLKRHKKSSRFKNNSIRV